MKTEPEMEDVMYQDEPLDLSMKKKHDTQEDSMINQMTDPMIIAQFHAQFMANLMMMHVGAQETSAAPAETMQLHTPPSSPPSFEKPVEKTIGKEIKRKKFLNARMTAKLSPYMINRLEQKGVLDQLDQDNPTSNMPYNPNKVRNFKKNCIRTEKQQNQREKNNLAGRQSRYKLKIIEDAIKDEVKDVENENITVKRHLAKLRAYANSLIGQLGNDFVNWNNAFKLEMLSAHMQNNIDIEDNDEI